MNVHFESVHQNVEVSNLHIDASALLIRGYGKIVVMNVPQRDGIDVEVERAIDGADMNRLSQNEASEDRRERSLDFGERALIDADR